MTPNPLVAGIVYSVLSFLPIPLYARIIWILLTHPDCRKHQCYFLMAQIGIFDVLVILGEGIFGITIATTHPLFGVTEYIAMPISTAAFMAMLAVNFVLSVNRLNVICELKLSTRYVLAPLMLLSWLFGLFFFISYVSQLSPLIIYDGLTYFYDMDVPYSVIVEQIELYSAVLILSATLLIYIYVISHLFRRRKTFMKNNTAARAHEIKLLVQSLLVFLICGLLEVEWNVGDYLWPASLWTNCIGNTIFIFHSGWINPGLCLLLNR